VSPDPALPRLADYLSHMRQATAEALEFTAGMDRSSFDADRRTQQAVIMSLVILGEAATKIMAAHPDYAAIHPELPWRAMRGMRNRFAHGYFEIDLDVVWNTVSTALPELQRQLAALQPAGDHTVTTPKPAK
jgi:uncharacterized protein with HEPN domain